MVGIGRGSYCGSTRTSPSTAFFIPIAAEPVKFAGCAVGNATDTGVLGRGGCGGQPSTIPRGPPAFTAAQGSDRFRPLAKTRRGGCGKTLHLEPFLPDPGYVDRVRLGKMVPPAGRSVDNQQPGPRSADFLVFHENNQHLQSCSGSGHAWPLQFAHGRGFPHRLDGSIDFAIQADSGEACF